MATLFAVDNDRAMLDVYRELVVMMNHELVAEATDGKQAIDLYKRLEKYPDIVLMNYRMPGMNGIDSMLEMRRINPEQHIILIAPDDDIAMDAKALGANVCVLKPFRLDYLSRTINTMISGMRNKKNMPMRF